MRKGMAKARDQWRKPVWPVSSPTLEAQYIMTTRNMDRPLAMSTQSNLCFANAMVALRENTKTTLMPASHQPVKTVVQLGGNCRLGKEGPKTGLHRNGRIGCEQQADGREKQYRKSNLGLTHVNTVLRQMWRESSYRNKALIGDFDLVVFDHRIGQQLFTHAGQLGARRFSVGAIENEIKNLALADALDAAKAEGGQRAFDGLALGVENASLERDGNARFHSVIPILLNEARTSGQRIVGFDEDAEALGHFPIAFDEATEILAETVLVEL